LAKVSANLGNPNSGKAKKGTLDSIFTASGSKSNSKIIHSLRKQVEFYFGDPNLTKDKSLRRMISQHAKGYIPLEKLLSFNKINLILFDAHFSSLKEKKKALLEAIKKSNILKLNKNGTLVKRRIPFNWKIVNSEAYKNQVNRRMIYVENLPNFTSHNMLADIFSQYGRILHISLPRHKTKAVKGFAFIEFEVRNLLKILSNFHTSLKKMQKRP
jgi:hypothetical protein